MQNIRLRVFALHRLKSSRRAQIRHRIAGFAGEDIIRHGDQCVFFDKHRAVFADEGQPVHIGIDHYAQIGLFADDRLRYFGQVLGQRFRVMGELSGRFAVEASTTSHPRLPQLGYDDAADGVHRIHDHLEAPPPHGFRIDQRQGQHPADMLVVVRLPRNDLADMVHIRENETLVFGQRQHPLALGVAQKFSLGIQEASGRSIGGGCAMR